MDLHLIIAGFKIVVTIIAAVLGVVGVLGNFKGPDNRATRSGQAVIAGTILAAAAGIGASIFEGYKARSDAIQQAARTEQLLKEVTRAIQPITGLEITHWVRLPSGAPAVSTYLERISKEVERRRSELEKDKWPRKRDPDLDVSSRDVDRKLLSVQISPKSALWPKGGELPLGVVARTLGFDVYVRRRPIDPESFEPFISVEGDRGGGGDWIAVTILPQDRENVLSFQPKTKTLEIFGSTHYDKRLWRSNGRITSATDLYGAQLILVPRHAVSVTKGSKQSDLLKSSRERDLSRLIELKLVVLRFSEGREFWLRGDAFKKTRLKYDYDGFSIVLPTSEEGFEKIRPKE